MGMAYKHDIERAGNYLLKLLAEEPEVNYSRFYDGEDETEISLLLGMGFTAEQIDRQHDDDYNGEPATDCPASYMDVAVGQLEEAGIVETRPTGEKLADDEPGYAILLTDKGRALLKSRKKFQYRDMML